MDFIFLLLSFINMSLLITSSQSKNNLTNSIGIEKPEQYTNHLRGSLEIKPNSQIAVDSIKINREPLIDFQDDKTSMFWFGERLDETVRFPQSEVQESVSWPIVQENLIQSSLGIADFQDGFRRMLREAYCYHPEINTSSTQNGSLINRHILANTVLDGFEFQFQQVTAAPSPILVDDSQVVTVFSSDGSVILYDPSNGSITAGGDDTLALCPAEGSLGGPISLNNGSVTFNVSDTRSGALPATREFAVGLTRSYDHTKGSTPSEMTGFNSFIRMGENGGLGTDEDVFFDYAAEGKNGELKLYHFVREYDVDEYGEDTDLGFMEEIIYYEKNNTDDTANNGSNSSFATGSPLNVSEVQEITFNCQNEKLKIAITGDNFNGSIVIDVVKTDSASFTRQIPKPINQACWKMYPQVYIPNSGKVVAVKDYHCRKGDTMNTNLFFGSSDWQARCSGQYYTGANYQKDESKQVIWQGSRFWPSYLERRDIMLVTNKQAPLPKNPYKGVSGDLMDGYENIIICAQNDVYLSEMLKDQWQPNVGRQLGMFPYTIFPPTASVSANVGSSFTSESVPETSSQSSAFIRLPRFGHTTFNAGKGSVSKIVGMVPRFDNAGNEKGALFFQKPDRLYVDLNNTDTINLTDITVDIVRRDETFVEDLTGGTEVVFHIREKPRTIVED